MLDVFGAEMLNTMHKSRMDVWTNGCPSFSTQEIESIQVIIDVKSHLNFFAYLFEMVIYYSMFISRTINLKKYLSKLPFSNYVT
jgi:predicted aconitase